MIRNRTGNLLDSDAQALVNSVNTDGIMGKGIALMFKQNFPINFREYAAACARGEVRTGRIFVTDNAALRGPRWIINFPTKGDWRDKTRVEWIEQGQDNLRRVIVDKEIRSLALPPLGCGNGGLHWSQVKPLIERALHDLQDVEVQIYEPPVEHQNVAKPSGPFQS